MKSERVSLLVRPQFWVATVALALALGGMFGVQQSLVGESGYSGPVPVIKAQKLPQLKGATPRPVDCAQVPCMALTFDDGPNPSTTPQIVDILDRANVRGTFFMVGQRVPGNEAILRLIYQGGHEIGNHSWNHADLTKLPPSQVRDQVSLTQQAVISAGLPPPRLFRPPYGALNDTVRSQVPLTLALWNIDPDDWKNTDPNVIAALIEAHARPGSVVVLHDIYPTTVQMLGPLVDRLKVHYQLVTVSDLFNLGPGQRGMYFGR